MLGIKLWYNSFAMDIKKFVRPNIYSLSAYEAKEIPCKVKLDANESPYGFNDAMKALKSVTTNRYPDPEARSLKKLIAGDLKIRSENILQGNGSDELIYYLVTVFGGPILYPVPTFSMYGIISQALGNTKFEVPLDKEFDLDIKKILNVVRKEKPKLIFLSSPNNPTGNCFSSEKMLKIIESASSKSIVVVDEAYQPFASDKGFVPMLADYENLVIMRTLSKIGLAGLRVGFLIAKEEIIREVNKVRLPFNLNSFSQAIASEALTKKALMRQNIKSIVSERGRLFSEMSDMEGVRPYPSEANFILFSVKSAERIYKDLLKNGVLVRNMKGVVEGCLRVTIGTPVENRIFLKALNRAVKNNRPGTEDSDEKSKG
jgi:histidinol-phosphate aminotransferase